MELPFATQQHAIFLNQSIVTLCLKPANGFSLHRNKIQTPYHHLQSETWMIWPQYPFSFCILTSYTPDMFFLVPWPQGLCTCTLLLYTLFPNLFMLACFLSFRSQFKWQSLTMACPDYHGQSRSTHSLSWHGFIFLLQNPYQYLKSVYLFTCVPSILIHQNLSFMSSRTQFPSHCSRIPLPKPVSGPVGVE